VSGSLSNIAFASAFENRYVTPLWTIVHRASGSLTRRTAEALTASQGSLRIGVNRQASSQSPPAGVPGSSERRPESSVRKMRCRATVKTERKSADTWSLSAHGLHGSPAQGFRLRRARRLPPTWRSDPSRARVRRQPTPKKELPRQGGDASVAAFASRAGGTRRTRRSSS
jgi:hypothetical protein